MKLTQHMPELPHMDTGTKVSISGHGVLVLFALFWGPLFESDQSMQLQISDVSLLSETEFAALSAGGKPAAEADVKADVEAASTPAEDTTKADAVEEVVPEAVEPELPIATEPVAEAEPVEETPPAMTQDETEPVQEIAPSAQEVEVAIIQPEPELQAEATPVPQAAPRVTDEMAPEKPLDAQTAPVVQEEIAPEAGNTAEQEVQAATAPDASSTQIVTEVDQPATKNAPKESNKPVVRPPDLLAKVQAARAEEQARRLQAEALAASEAKAEAKAEAQASDLAQAEAEKVKQAAAKAEVEAANQQAKKSQAKADAAAKEAAKLAEAEAADQQAKEIEAALLQAMAEAEGAGTASTGNPMTASEMRGLMLAVQQCWNVPIGVEGASDLIVVLRARFSPDGALQGPPELIEPAGVLQGAQAQAFEAARRALIRCAPYDLPVDKYDQWQEIDVVFNPENMTERQ